MFIPGVSEMPFRFGFMPRFILEIELGNEAMKTSDDVVSALLHTAKSIDQTFDMTGKIHDDNGNTVGHYEVVP